MSDDLWDRVRGLGSEAWQGCECGSAWILSREVADAYSSPPLCPVSVDLKSTLLKAQW